MAKARMFRVLAEVVQMNTTGTRQSTSAPCVAYSPNILLASTRACVQQCVTFKPINDHRYASLIPEASLGGRVKDAKSKSLVAKQLGNMNTSQLPEFDLDTGAFKVKKPKKDKSPRDLAVLVLKELEKEILDSNYWFLSVTHFTTFSIVFSTCPPQTCFWMNGPEGEGHAQ